MDKPKYQQFTDLCTALQKLHPFLNKNQIQVKAAVLWKDLKYDSVLYNQEIYRINTKAKQHVIAKLSYWSNLSSNSQSRKHRLDSVKSSAAKRSRPSTSNLSGMFS